MPYNSKNASMSNPADMGEILESIDEIMLAHLMYNDKAMKYCHSVGYNGLKRMHRYNTRCFLEYHMKIENEAYDKYRMTLETMANDPSYAASDILDHLHKWDIKLGEDIKKLGMLNNEYREIAGKDNCVIDEALGLMCHNYEKAGRWYKRFAETKSAHDMHDLDDYIHTKYKAKEESKGY